MWTNASTTEIVLLLKVKFWSHLDVLTGDSLAEGLYFGGTRAEERTLLAVGSLTLRADTGVGGEAVDHLQALLWLFLLNVHVVLRCHFWDELSKVCNSKRGWCPGMLCRKRAQCSTFLKLSPLRFDWQISWLACFCLADGYVCSVSSTSCCNILTKCVFLFCPPAAAPLWIRITREYEQKKKISVGLPAGVFAQAFCFSADMPGLWNNAERS